MKKTIFFIAGEPSGDAICAKILQYLKDDFNITGVFGEKVEKMGFKSLFSMYEISVMGFVEVVLKIFKIIPKINQTINNIIATNPDLIVTIDSPGFAKTVVKKLRKIGYKGQILHIVAPSVWAYREKRAKKMAKLFDRLCCFFEFEPKYFEKYGLKSDFVGNISIEDELIKIKETDYFPFENNPKTIAITLGSRKMEIKKHIKTIFQFISQYKEGTTYIFPTFSRYKHIIENEIKKQKLDNKYLIYSDENAMKNAISECDIAIAKSGTNVLQFLSNFKPTIVYYKANWLSYLIIKSIIKIKFTTLVNIITNKMIVPELIQGKFTVKNINKNLTKINTYKSKNDLKKALLSMLNKEKPSELTAKIIKKMIENA